MLSKRYAIGSEALPTQTYPETPGVKLHSLAPVAQGIERRFRKPLGTSAVPQPLNAAETAFGVSDSCELCAVAQAGFRNLAPLDAGFVGGESRG